jgi:hypothetical protein
MVPIRYRLGNACAGRRASWKARFRPSRRSSPPTRYTSLCTWSARRDQHPLKSKRSDSGFPTPVQDFFRWSRFDPGKSFPRSKSAIEGCQSKARTDRQSGQIGIAPYAVGKPAADGIFTPMGLKILRFFNEPNPGIFPKRIEAFPCFFHGQGIVSECRRIAGDTEKTLLRVTAEKAGTVLKGFVPCGSPCVMDVSFESERKPYVDVRKKVPHHPRPEG